MKHVVHVSNDFEPITGGINTHLKNLLRCLTDEGFEVTLLVPSASKEKITGISDRYEDRSKPFTVVRYYYRNADFKPLKLLRLTKATRAGLDWVNTNIGKIDLIHQHDQRATRLGATSFSTDSNIPIVWTNHSTAYFKKRNYMLREILKWLKYQPDGVIAVHKRMAELLSESEFSNIPVRYIPNGVDTRDFVPGKKSDSEKITVLFPQRIIPGKGAETLAKSARLILDKYQNTNISFWFAGSELSPNHDARSIRKVKELLSEYTDSNAIKFQGNPSYEEMPRYYRCADIVVLPLSVETENISVFEAWASGTPLITTTQVWKNGYMRNEENCLIIPEFDHYKLASAILRLSCNLKLREKLSVNGRALVQDRFTWTHTADKVISFYQKILDHHKG